MLFRSEVFGAANDITTQVFANKFVKNELANAHFDINNDKLKSQIVKKYIKSDKLNVLLTALQNWKSKASDVVDAENIDHLVSKLQEYKDFWDQCKFYATNK